MKNCIAKPFLKWAGGKKQLITDIETRLPDELRTEQIKTYVEPFVGGGAIFFYIAQKYDCIEHFYLYYINQDLVNCYNAIKDDVESLIKKLEVIQHEYLDLNENKRKIYLEVLSTHYT